MGRHHLPPPSPERAVVNRPEAEELAVSQGVLPPRVDRSRRPGSWKVARTNRTDPGKLGAHEVDLSRHLLLVLEVEESEVRLELLSKKPRHAKHASRYEITQERLHCPACD